MNRAFGGIAMFADPGNQLAAFTPRECPERPQSSSKNLAPFQGIEGRDGLAYDWSDRSKRTIVCCVTCWDAAETNQIEDGMELKNREQDLGVLAELTSSVATLRRKSSS
jgi:hypothetical protein